MKTTRFQKGQIPWNKGKTMSEETKKKLSKKLKGKTAWNKGTKGLIKSNSGTFGNRSSVNENHPRWKDKPSYQTLHKWASRHIKEKHTKCQFCGKQKPLHSANKSGKYLRELDDYFALCAMCHRWYDRYYNGNKLIPLSKLRKLILKWYQQNPR